jgi:hypothetical protein
MQFEEWLREFFKNDAKMLTYISKVLNKGEGKFIKGEGKFIKRDISGIKTIFRLYIDLANMVADKMKDALHHQLEIIEKKVSEENGCENLYLNACDNMKNMHKIISIFEGWVFDNKIEFEKETNNQVVAIHIKRR